MSRGRAAKYRRTKQLRRKYLTTAVSFAVLLLCVSFIRAGMLSFASEENSTAEYKYYRSVVIPFGEDAESVIQTHYDETHFRSLQEYRREVLQINHLHTVGNEIFPAVSAGEALILPYFDRSLR